MESDELLRASPEPIPELVAFLAPFERLFRRATTFGSFERYVTGLLTELRHKTCDTIAGAVAGITVERLQYLLTDASWDAEAVDRLRVQGLVSRSPKGGILVIDDTGLPKQGKASVGVAHQYCGTLGKIANCQVIVSSVYVADTSRKSRPAHWPVRGHLYLPRKWTQDLARCRKARIPDEVGFKDKPEIAIELIDQAREWGVPYKYVVADGGYGDNPSFLQELEKRKQLYVCGVHSDFGVRLPDEVRRAQEAPLPEYTGIGTRSRQRKSAPLRTVEAITADLPDGAWQTVVWRKGTKEALSKQFVAMRVHRAVGQSTEANRRGANHSCIQTGPEGWLLAERPEPGEDGLKKWYYSNLPAKVSLRRLVTVAHSRWITEQFYEDCKGECGLDHYQGRLWDGLHRHIALVMLSYSFLAQTRLAQSQHALEGFFPRRGRLVAESSPSTSPEVSTDRYHQMAIHQSIRSHKLPSEEVTK